MTVDEAIVKLTHIANLQTRGDRDLEGHHEAADQILLDLINNPLVTDAYQRIQKWYA